MTRIAAWLRAVALMPLALAAAEAAALPDDAAVRAILSQRISQKQGMGFAVVLIDKAGARIVTAGAVRRDGPEVAADTEFEIGSITKTFTSLLLADAVAIACLRRRPGRATPKSSRRANTNSSTRSSTRSSRSRATAPARSRA